MFSKILYLALCFAYLVFAKDNLESNVETSNKDSIEFKNNDKKLRKLQERENKKLEKINKKRDKERLKQIQKDNKKKQKELDSSSYKDEITQKINRIYKAQEDIESIYQRENKRTLSAKDKLPLNVLLEGAIDAKNKEEIKKAARMADQRKYKSHLLFGGSFGFTYTSVADNQHYLPTFNLRFGYQNFLGITSNSLGFKLSIDTNIASNILKSLTTNAYEDFVDTTFTATSINAEAIFESPISNRFMFGAGGGYGIGYMTYHDKYWDSFNGYCSNLSLFLYISYKNRHKFELSFRTFFYHYGYYVMRELGVSNSPSTILSNDFARPINLNIGWTYVF